MRAKGENRHRRRWLVPAVFLGLLLTVLVLGRYAGDFLVVDHPVKSGALVVLAGDQDDVRYWKGLDLLRSGYARSMIYDVPSNTVAYGVTVVDLAQQFVARSAGAWKERILICPISGRSTAAEAVNVAACLRQLPAAPQRVLLVTSDYHTRRALDIFRYRLPGYQWSVAAAYDRRSFGRQWWKHREWAAFCLGEWERYLWWQLVDRWRDGPIHRNSRPGWRAQASVERSMSKR